MSTGDLFNFSREGPKPEQVGALGDFIYINVVEARDLSVADTGGLANPFCSVKVGNHSYQNTGTLEKTLNPKWNATFVFARPAGHHPRKKKESDADPDSWLAKKKKKIEEAEASQASDPGKDGAQTRVKFKIQEQEYWGLAKAKLLGYVEIDVADVKIGEIRDLWEDLKGVEKVKTKFIGTDLGRLRVRISTGNSREAPAFPPLEKGIVQPEPSCYAYVTVLAAKDLPWKDKDSCHPYCEVEINAPSQHTLNETRHATTDPVWSDQDEKVFQLSRDSRYIEVKVLNDVSVAFSHMFGLVRIPVPKAQVGPQPAPHFQWHPLQPAEAPKKGPVPASYGEVMIKVDWGWEPNPPKALWQRPRNRPILGQLVVDILECRNLPTLDNIAQGLPVESDDEDMLLDSFVSVHFEGRTENTSVAEGTPHPRFMQRYTFDVTEVTSDLVVQCWENDPLWPQILGRICLPVAPFQKEGGRRKELWLELLPPDPMKKHFVPQRRPAIRLGAVKVAVSLQLGASWTQLYCRQPLLPDPFEVADMDFTLGELRAQLSRVANSALAPFRCFARATLYLQSWKSVPLNLAHAAYCYSMFVHMPQRSVGMLPLHLAALTAVLGVATAAFRVSWLPTAVWADFPDKHVAERIRQRVQRAEARWKTEGLVEEDDIPEERPSSLDSSPEKAERPGKQGGSAEEQPSSPMARAKAATAEQLAEGRKGKEKKKEHSMFSWGHGKTKDGHKPSKASGSGGGSGAGGPGDKKEAARPLEGLGKVATKVAAGLRGLAEVPVPSFRPRRDSLKLDVDGLKAAKDETATHNIVTAYYRFMQAMQHVSEWVALRVDFLEQLGNTLVWKDRRLTGLAYIALLAAALLACIVWQVFLQASWITVVLSYQFLRASEMILLVQMAFLLPVPQVTFELILKADRQLQRLPLQIEPFHPLSPPILQVRKAALDELERKKNLEEAEAKQFEALKQLDQHQKHLKAIVTGGKKVATKVDGPKRPWMWVWNVLRRAPTNLAFTNAEVIRHIMHEEAPFADWTEYTSAKQTRKDRRRVLLNQETF